MIKQKHSVEELFKSLDQYSSELIRLLSSFSETKINTIPFRGGWTAAQVGDHVTKSNQGMIRLLNSEGRPATREADQRVEQLESQFLNFSEKLQSPQFILPTKDIYQKDRLISDLKLSIEELKTKRTNVNLSDAVDHFIFGEITKLELLFFVLFHTQRHIHQLKNISRVISAADRSKTTRKIISFMHVSLDGFVAGANGDMSWIAMDDEIFENAIELASATDTALYGRTTYQMMESYWPTVLSSAEATSNEIKHAQWVQDVNKIVFSTSLPNAEWNNTILIRKNIREEMTELKQQPGGNMMIFGSPRLTHSFMQMGLIDEYRINLNPVVLGTGIPLFKNINDRVNLRLLKEKKFQGGVIGLHYETKQFN